MSNAAFIQEINNGNTQMKLEYLRKIAEIFPKVNWDKYVLARQPWTTIIRQTYVLLPSTIAINSVLKTISPHELSAEAGRLYTDILTRGFTLFPLVFECQACFTDGGASRLIVPSNTPYNNGFPAIAYNVAPDVVQIQIAYDMPGTDNISWLLAGTDTQCAIFQPVEATPDILQEWNALYKNACKK